jgi:hypothetical protein
MEPAPPPADPPADPSPQRQLDRAPGERYLGPPREGRELPASRAAQPLGRPSPTKAVVSGSIAAVIALVVFLIFAGPLSFAPGLVVIAIFAGRLIGLTVKSAAGPTLSSDARTVTAMLLTLGWFAAAQVGIWLYARSEGGALGLFDYLGQVFGGLVPLQAIAAVLIAWWSAR